MYISKSTTESDPAVLRAFIEKYPLASITGKGESKWVASLIPLLLQSEAKEEWILEGHLHLQAEHTKVWRQFPEVFVQFLGPQAYISNGWYPDPGRAATWNYVTIQGAGKIEFKDPTETFAILRRQIEQFEKNLPNPQRIEDLPQAYIEAMLPQIVGITITIRLDSLQSCFKLSRDESEEPFTRILEGLRERGHYGDLEMAQCMAVDRTRLKEKES